MNKEELEQKFGAIVIAVQNGKIDIARKIFDITLEKEIEHEIDQVIESMKRNIEVLLLKGN